MQEQLEFILEKIKAGYTNIISQPRRNIDSAFRIAKNYKQVLLKLWV